MAQQFTIGEVGGRIRDPQAAFDFKTELPAIVRNYRPQPSVIVDPNVDIEGENYLDESRITSTSQPYIRVIFNPHAPEEYQFYAERTEITSAEFEGKTNVSRKGQVEIRDPEGYWPHILTEVGRTSNAYTQQRFPNIKVLYGWVGLGPGRGAGASNGRDVGASSDPISNSYVAAVDGQITKVEFDLAADGTNVVRVAFIETYLEALSKIRFIYPEDFQWIHSRNRSKDWSSKGGKEGALGILNALCNPDSGSRGGLKIHDDIEKSGLRIRFDGESIDEVKKVEIRYGDFLLDVVNKLINEVIHPSTEEGTGESDSKLNYRYERTTVSDPDLSGESVTALVKSGTDSVEHEVKIVNIIYDWKAVPVEGEEDNYYETVTEDTKTGPALYWKKQGPPETTKRLVEWNADLNSVTHLMYSAQDELTKQLNTLNEDDWELVQGLMSSYGEGWDDTDNVTSGFLARWRPEFRNERTEVVERFKEKAKTLFETAARGNASSNTLKSIIRDNVFKGTAKILGDPSFGSSHIPWKCTFKMDFDSINAFTSLFSKRWMLTNTKHIFSEGSYITELEVQTYPGLMTKQERAEEAGIRFDASGNAVGA